MNLINSKLIKEEKLLYVYVESKENSQLSKVRNLNIYNKRGKKITDHKNRFCSFYK
jgi:hypothetical protein